MKMLRSLLVCGSRRLGWPALARRRNAKDKGCMRWRVKKNESEGGFNEIEGR